MNSITNLSATELVQQIRKKEISPVEVFEEYLQHIATLNPKLNAIVTLASDLKDQASKAEAAVMRGEKLGPLHGLPVTVKDTIETRDLRSTSGSAMRADFVPAADAPAVARLKSAGAIILGKTNAAEMAMDYNADNPVFGRTNNPHDPTRTPGGSSGGEAAAIATHMSPVGLGSDLAGSIRIPAHFCGVAGLKPTTGRVPGEGQFPPSTGPYSLGAVIGPLARTVEDLELLFSVVAGVDSSSINAESLRGQRVAWYAADSVAPVTNETRAAVKTAAQTLADAGLVIEETIPPGIDRGHDLWLQLFSRASVVQLRKVYQGNEDRGGDFVRWRLATADDAPAPTLDQYIQSWMERDRLREELLRWMVDVPLLVAPVGSVNAPEHGALKAMVNGEQVSMFRAFSYSQAFNVFDLPVVCVPAGRSSDGMPIGVQIIGRPFSESMVLAAASIVEKSARRGVVTG